MSISAEALGRAVRDARESRGLSRREITEQAGIGKTALFDLEHGNPGVRFNTLVAVLDLLGLDLELSAGASAPSAVKTAPPAARKPEPPEPEPVLSSADPLPDHLL